MAVGPLLVAVRGNSDLPATTQLLGGFTWFLATLPAYRYLKRRPSSRRPLPFLETVSLLYGMYYALPVALGDTNRAWRITVNPSTGYDVPMQLAFLGWVAMMAAYRLASHLFRSRRRPRDFPWNPRYVARWASALLIAGVLINGLRPILSGDIAIGGFLQLFVSLQWLGIGLLTVLSRRGELSSSGRALLVGGFLAAVTVALAQGNVSPVLLLCMVVAFALWAGRPLIEPAWIFAGVAALLIAIAARGVMRDFRMSAWFSSQQPTFTQRVHLVSRLLTDRVANEGLISTISGGGAQVVQRSATMDMFADVIRRTPSEVPYWQGDTYYSLVGALTPRFLWRNKPTKELGQAFGHRYRYLDPTNKSTAINLPILVEFYANFGTFAVVVGMFLVGAIYGILDTIVNRPRQSLMFSMIGLTLLLPLLLIESDFSLVFGGLPLSGLALWGIWVAMRHAVAGKAPGRTSRPARLTPYDARQLEAGRRGRPALPAG
jgi:hypothetical protein